jgi:hypothetical protein
MVVEDDVEANLMTGQSQSVDGIVITFYRVLKMEQLAKEDDLFQSGYTIRVWPLERTTYVAS